jgi:hypothetical protein
LDTPKNAEKAEWVRPTRLKYFLQPLMFSKQAKERGLRQNDATPSSYSLTVSA